MHVAGVVVSVDAGREALACAVGVVGAAAAGADAEWVASEYAGAKARLVAATVSALPGCAPALLGLAAVAVAATGGGQLWAAGDATDLQCAGHWATRG